MRIFFLAVVAASLCLGLTACSDRGKETYSVAESNDGLLIRPGICTADPRRFAEAEPIGSINDGGGCGVANAYQVSAISGVSLSQNSIFNCSVVYTTSQWLERVVQPAAEDAFGERVAKIEVVSSYACRTRNSKPGAKLSEHAKGNAIDVAAFVLESGERISVLEGWSGGSRKERKFLQEARSEACGMFKTVLGPGSDSHHKDHFHLDLQQHRSGGAYCR